MASSSQELYVSYMPYTFSYCPAISADNFVTGFAACERLGSSNYSTAWPLSQPGAIPGNFSDGSLSYNISEGIATRASLGVDRCGPDVQPQSLLAAAGLSCVQQVSLAPYILPGGFDDSFFTCAAGAIGRSGAVSAEAVIVSILLAIFFCIPIGAVCFVCFYGRVKRSKKAAAVSERYSSAVLTGRASQAEHASQVGGGGGTTTSGGGSGLIKVVKETVAIVADLQELPQDIARLSTRHEDDEWEREGDDDDDDDDDGGNGAGGSGGGGTAAAAPAAGAPSGSSSSSKPPSRRAKGGEAGRVYLSFEDVYYSVTLHAAAQKTILEEAKAAGKTKADMPPLWNTKVLIKGVSGVFAPGTLAAIMGPSGCGKSTLLNVLADRMRTGNATGKILLNGRPRGYAFKRACGYVMQSDALFANLTVREMLSFTAELRVAGDDAALKGERVARVLRELDLTRVADSRIGGGSIRGISGGQARRCTVGVELVTQPSVLFLDEPTTGLDAYSSLLLVRSLRTLADSGRTVLCTIHQPRPDIFALFDTLLLMSAGEVAYFGARGHISDYLGTVGISIPDDVNPADFVVDLTYARDEARVVDELVGRWRTSTEGRAMGRTVTQLGDGSFPGLGADLQCVEDLYDRLAAATGKGSKGAASQPGTNGKAAAGGGSAFARPLLWQIYSLMRRAYTNTLRSPDFVQRIMGFPLLNYLFFGLLYVGTRAPREVEPGFTADDVAMASFESLISQKRSFYFQVMATAILTESSVMGEAFDEQRAFRREHASGAYSIVAYHLQWMLRLNFRAIYKSIVFAGVVYFFPAHAPDSANAGLFLTWLFFLVVMCVCSTVGSALALVFISLIPDAEGAAGAHNAISAVLLQYSGFYLLPCLMPPFVNTAYFISFGKYALEAMLLNEFATVPYGSEWNLYNSVLQSIDPTISRWLNVAILMLYPFVFHLLAMLSSMLQTAPKSFWAPLEDWLHRKFPARYPYPRDVLARGGKPTGAADIKAELAVSSTVSGPGESV